MHDCNSIPCLPFQDLNVLLTTGVIQFTMKARDLQQACYELNAGYNSEIALARFTYYEENGLSTSNTIGSNYCRYLYLSQAN